MIFLLYTGTSVNCFGPCCGQNLPILPIFFAKGIFYNNSKLIPPLNQNKSCETSCPGGCSHFDIKADYGRGRGGFKRMPFHWSRAGWLALGTPGCSYVWLSPCRKWPNTQENGCSLPPSDQIQNENLFLTRQDQERGMNGQASRLHS